MEQSIEYHLGKHWAAIKNDEVVGTLSMQVPSSTNFEAYRSKAVACLELLGDVKSGEIIEKGNERYFIQRPNHARRSKNPKPAKEFLIFHPAHKQNESEITG